jgi:hypothetical protein
MALDKHIGAYLGIYTTFNTVTSSLNVLLL